MDTAAAPLSGNMSSRARRWGDLTYLQVLTWAFAFFNSLRILSYLPTMWAISQSGDSSQYSLWTWFAWLGANLTMAGWLHEHNARRFNRVATLSLCNALMCLLTVAFIVWYRP